MARELPPQRRMGSMLLRWHAWIGVTCALVVVVVAATGILVNHARSLDLQRIYVDAPIVLGQYNLVPDEASISFSISRGWITWLEGNLYLNDARIAEQAGQGVGAVSNGTVIVAAAHDQVLLLALDGTLIERIPGQTFSGSIATIGLAETGEVIIGTDNARFAADREFIEWTPTPLDAVWSTPGDLPTGIEQRILTTLRGEGIAADRLLLDIHTGRFFGTWGPYVVDLAALALVFMAVSGSFSWLKALRRRKGKPEHVR